MPDPVLFDQKGAIATITPDRLGNRLLIRRRHSGDGRRTGNRRSSPADTTRYYRAGIQRIPLPFERLDVPVIAAVNGAAVGARLDLACMCDIRIAAEGARFAESLVRMGCCCA